eukprot:2392442-Amphidinium_carterae.1
MQAVPNIKAHQLQQNPNSKNTKGNTKDVSSDGCAPLLAANPKLICKLVSRSLQIFVAMSSPFILQ